MNPSKTLSRALQQLTRDERRIMWVFAVVYEGVNQTGMKRILSALGWKTEQGTQLSGLMEKTLREKLLKKKLLVEVQGKLACAEAVAELLAREAQQQGVFGTVMTTAKGVVPLSTARYFYSTPSSIGRSALRGFRDALYLGDERYFNTLLASISKFTPSARADYLVAIAELCLKSFDASWFAKVPEAMQYQILTHVAFGPIDTLVYQYLWARWEQAQMASPNMRRLLLGWRLHNGRLEQFDDILPSDKDWQNDLLRASWLSLQGQYFDAVPVFERAQKQLRKQRGKRSLVIDGLPGLWFLLALLANRDHYQKTLLRQMAAATKSSDEFEAPYRLLYQFQAVIEGKQRSETLAEAYELTGAHPTGEHSLLYAYMCYWLGEPTDQALLLRLAELAVSAQKRGDAWYVCQSIALLKHYFGSGDTNDLSLEQLKPIKPRHLNALKALLEHGAGETGDGETDIAPIIDLFQAQAPWERALDALNKLHVSAAPVSQRGPQNMRLAWFLDDSYGEYSLQPKEQKLGKNGRWTKGRVVSLKRLSQELDSFDYLTEQDRKICEKIESDYTYYGYEYRLDGGQVLEAAVDHPSIFRASAPDQPVEIHSREPELIVSEKDQQLFIQLDPPLGDVDEHQDFIVQHEGSQRLRVIRFTRQHQQIAEILGPNGLSTPLNAKTQVLQSLGAIAPLLPIQSDIGGGSHASEVAVDPNLYMHIQPQQDRLKFDLAVQPLGVDGPRFRPGEGRAKVMAEVNGERLQTSRQLDQELNQQQQLLKACAALHGSAWDSHDSEWVLEGDEALEALYQLQSCDDWVQLLWPKGGALTLSREAQISQMQMSIRQQQDWFALDGELHLDDGQVVSMGQLLSLIQQSPGRFIRLGDDAFITLTEQLRQRLESLHRHGDNQHYHPLAANALEALTDGMLVEEDHPWQAQTQRMEAAYPLEVNTPTTLQAELRDYQKEGLTWLTRLAHWGAGACLADDMGLGKTLQSLALILTRAAKGPTLILAPTSVCMNWLKEAERFAPTLKPLRFGDGDRQSVVDNAGPYDLVVCSYGLLQTEHERLQGVHWHTIVADEAQALKNPQAKRTQAAMRLQGDFKMVATGTPIENHLGELWTLFRFINPGLLGSQDAFNQRFASPIENQQDKVARQQLKRLVQPFILRRLKSDVLTELPPRTEITVNIPQNDEEAALYEALRRQALEKLAENNQDNSGQQHLKVLAEIMRLRRACCNPRLVMPNSTIASSKLEAFGNIFDELRENHHRALVFSQFVDHLALIRAYLDERNISYQYLDGSTSIKKREQAVEAFQQGQGELFLISLKAGGSGLNLTAADYVVHMDPWWNPAVEDQASDRAHRMGQTRPVTIYRLVSQNTIEQKILALHSQKRDLADSLLAGTDSSGKLSVDEVMALIRN